LVSLIPFGPPVAFLAPLPLQTTVHSKKKKVRPPSLLAVLVRKGPSLRITKRQSKSRCAFELSYNEFWDHLRRVSGGVKEKGGQPVWLVWDFFFFLSFTNFV